MREQMYELGNDVDMKRDYDDDNHGKQKGDVIGEWQSCHKRGGIVSPRCLVESVPPASNRPSDALCSPPVEPIRAVQQLVEQPTRALLVPELDHIHDTRAHTLVAQLNCDARLAHTLDAIGEHDRRDQYRLVFVIRLDDELLHVRRVLAVQLQPRAPERLPLCVVLLQEYLALHLCRHR